MIRLTLVFLLFWSVGRGQTIAQLTKRIDAQDVQIKALKDSLAARVFKFDTLDFSYAGRVFRAVRRAADTSNLSYRQDTTLRLLRSIQTAMIQYYKWGQASDSALSKRIVPVNLQPLMDSIAAVSVGLDLTNEQVDWLLSSEVPAVRKLAENIKSYLRKIE